jgi:hypothetical protein
VIEEQYLREDYQRYRKQIDETLAHPAGEKSTVIKSLAQGLPIKILRKGIKRLGKETG